MDIAATILSVSGTARVRVYPGHPTNGGSHVAVYNEDGRLLMTFAGGDDALHGLFLGLHEALIDAGRGGGRAELIIPGRQLVDEVITEAGGLADDDGESYTSGQA